MTPDGSLGARFAGGADGRTCCAAERYGRSIISTIENISFRPHSLKVPVAVIVKHSQLNQGALFRCGTPGR